MPMKTLVSVLAASLLVVSIFAASPVPTGDWKAHGLKESQRERIRAAFQKGIDETFIPGGSLTIIHKGEIILKKDLGSLIWIARNLSMRMHLAG